MKKYPACTDLKGKACKNVWLLNMALKTANNEDPDEMQQNAAFFLIRVVTVCSFAISGCKA